MLHAKNNLAPKQKGLAFRLEQTLVDDGVMGSRVYFDSEYVSRTADEALAAERDSDGGSDKDATIEFVRALLADGPLKVETIQKEARAAGLLGEDQSIGQSKPFRSARNALSIKPYQPKGEKSGGWVWGMPDQSPKRGDGKDHSHPPHQMPSDGQMPSNKRASDIPTASDGRCQVPPGYQMPSNDRASDGKGHLTPSRRNTRDDFPGIPTSFDRPGPPGDSWDDF
jgi:hypothetical protein